MTPAERVGRNIRRIRRAQDLSQEALAEQAQLHRTAISYYEWGKQETKLPTLIKIAYVLGVRIEDLVEGITWYSERGEFVVKEP